MTLLPAYSELIELAWVAPLAVVIVCGSYSLLLLGATRSTELRREGSTGLATAYGVLATIGGVLFAAAVVAGLWVIVAG